MDLCLTFSIHAYRLHGLGPKRIALHQRKVETKVKASLTERCFKGTRSNNRSDQETRGREGLKRFFFVQLNQRNLRSCNVSRIFSQTGIFRGFFLYIIQRGAKNPLVSQKEIQDPIIWLFVWIQLIEVRVAWSNGMSKEDQFFQLFLELKPPLHPSPPPL